MKFRVTLDAGSIGIAISPTDLKELEDTLAHAVHRGITSAIRVIAKEGLFDVIAKVLEPPPPPEPLPVEPAPVEPPAPPPPPVETGAERRHKKTRHMRDILKTVGPKPNGYIDKAEAVELLGGTETARNRIDRWIFDREIRAVIVASVKPPTKGLPGRLFVDTESLQNRNLIHEHNLTLGPRSKSRDKAPVYSDDTRLHAMKHPGGTNVVT